MKNKVPALFLSVLFIVLFFVSCKKDKEVPTDASTVGGIKTIHGKVQKGPYKNGSPLVIYELNTSLGQTGKSFVSTINDDAGNFSLNNINLSSDYVLLTATGYYFNEHFNRMSEGQLYLEAFADVSNRSTVNVNLLTHIIKPRMEQLVSTGLDFNTSRTQAQNELLTAVGAIAGTSGNFETLDLSGNEFLFAMSLLFQRNNSFAFQMGYSYSAELSSLLSNFRSDFANNGVIDNSNIIDTLLYNAHRVDLIDSKLDMQNYYSGLGLTFTNTNFEQYIYAFQKKYSAVLGANLSFPNTAAIMIDAPGAQPPYTMVTNIISLNQNTYSVGNSNYCVSAIVPYDSDLVVKITPKTLSNPFSNFGGGMFGWKFTQVGNTFIYTAQRKNIELCAFIQYPGNDSVKVEYFNSLTAATPYLTRKIVFN